MHGYAVWHRLRRFRRRRGEEHATRLQDLNVRCHVTAANNFLGWRTVEGLRLGTCTQTDLDTICQLVVDNVQVDGDTVSITFGTSLVVLPAPLACLVRELVATRRGKAKIGTPEDVPWLFPGGHPGRPLTDSQIVIRLHKIGI